MKSIAKDIHIKWSILFATSLTLILTTPVSLEAFAITNPTRQSSDIPNIQASFPVTGGATDRTGTCVNNAQYNNHHAESWLAIDPTNPEHLVAMSKFYYDPLYYLSHIGGYASNDAGIHWTDSIIPGFDCQTAPSTSWVDTTDPILAFDSQGRIYSAILAYSFRYNPKANQVWGVVPNDAVYVVKSTDGGNTWTMTNAGNPLAIYNSAGLGKTADKQWITADSNVHSPYSNNVYAAWTVFKGGSSEIWFSRSTDQGTHFSKPAQLTTPNADGPLNTYAMMGTASDGSLYLVYTSLPRRISPVAHVWLLKSTDGGKTFSNPTLAASFTTSAPVLPNTTFRDGIADNFAVNPANGHLLLALEVDSGKGLDVQVTESTDGGSHWTIPINANDPTTVQDGTDQFQPTIAASPTGIVAVAFYDRRHSCPTSDPNILPDDAGKNNFCINTTIQFYNDATKSLKPLGPNIQVSSTSWDPQNPGLTTGQLPHPGGPNSALTFIGDYFGLALTNQNAYTLFTSNYNLGQNPSNDLQEYLATVPIPG